MTPDRAALRPDVPPLAAAQPFGLIGRAPCRSRGRHAVPPRASSRAVPRHTPSSSAGTRSRRAPARRRSARTPSPHARAHPARPHIRERRARRSLASSLRGSPHASTHALALARAFSARSLAAHAHFPCFDYALTWLHSACARLCPWHIAKSWDLFTYICRSEGVLFINARAASW